MVVIFAGIDFALDGGFSPVIVPILALTLACAGALVGAVHGLALVWLLRPARRLKHGGR
jgi:NhaP-type Na+/H+ or K+/H+ antiporter